MAVMNVGVEVGFSWNSNFFKKFNLAGHIYEFGVFLVFLALCGVHSVQVAVTLQGK